MAAPVFSQAWKGLISIGGSNFNALNIMFEESTDLEDITYTVAGGATFAILLAGYQKGKGSLDFVYDIANQPTISPFDMRAGTLLSIIMYPEGTKPYTLTAYSESFNWKSGPQSGVSVKCTVNFQTTGAFTMPAS